MLTKNFFDSIRNIYNSLANSRNPINNNSYYHSRVGYDELRSIYKTGIGSKIIRLKAGHAMRDSLVFSSSDEERYYTKRLKADIQRAVQFMIGFGRSIVVLYEKGEDLALPRTRPFEPNTVRWKVFSGDMVTAIAPSLDLMDDRYYMPKFYSVRGTQFHYSRVVDFIYYEPTEFDKPLYQYGGVPEFELIYGQLIHDAIVERAAPTILEKNSNLFYNVTGLKEAIQDGQEDYIKRYFAALEDGRSIYGAGLIDAEDSVSTVAQTLTNLSETDTITLRRIAMVTGIPLAVLIGENVKGLNSSGDNEMMIFQDMIETLQNDYILSPLQQVFDKLGFGDIHFTENQGRTPEQKIVYETSVIQNARALYDMGEDYAAYLEEHDVIQKDDVSAFFEAGGEE